MPEPATTGLTIVGAFAALIGCVLGRARLDKRAAVPTFAVEYPRQMPELRLQERVSADPRPAPSPPPSLEPMPLMERPVRCIVLKPAKAADAFITYLQDCKATGTYAAEEIDEAWLSAAEDLNVYPLSPQTIRGELEARGLLIGRKQLRLMYPEVAIRTGRTRATLYSIPAKGRSAARPPRATPDSPGMAPAAGGQRPGSAKNTSEFKEAA